MIDRRSNETIPAGTIELENIKKKLIRNRIRMILNMDYSILCIHLLLSYASEKYSMKHLSFSTAALPFAVNNVLKLIVGKLADEFSGNVHKNAFASKARI